MHSKKKEEVMSGFRLQRQGGRSQKKKSLISDWVENLADSNIGLILRPGAMAEGVERAAKRWMRPVGPHQHLVQGDQLKITVEEPLEDLEGPLS